MNRNSLSVDGGAGTGKGTMTKTIARVWTEAGRPTWAVDTGSFYRSIGVLAKNTLVKPGAVSSEGLQDIVSDIEYDHRSGLFMPAWLERDEEQALRILKSPCADEQSSIFGAEPLVREVVNEYCERMPLDNPDIVHVFDGREEFSRLMRVGQVPLLGLFLVVGAQERAARALGSGASRDEVAAEAKRISARDVNDSTRPLQPVKMYEGLGAERGSISFGPVDEHGRRNILGPEGLKTKVSGEVPVQFVLDTSTMRHGYSDLASFLLYACESLLPTPNAHV